jgi:hypothetical protein
MRVVNHKAGHRGPTRMRLKITAMLPIPAHITKLYFEA